jgi:LCP family protein required for cell wall assembly
MLVRIDMASKKIRGLSVPRDSYVMLHHKGGSMDKLNHAYFFGGAELSKSTVEAYTGVKVDHHVVVNYELFERVVDLAGGVPIDVEKRMDYDDNAGGLHIHLRLFGQLAYGQTLHFHLHGIAMIPENWLTSKEEDVLQRGPTITVENYKPWT